VTDIDYTRQRSWFDPNEHRAEVTIVGCGGIGSFTAFALAKLGVQQLRLLDFDTVEEHNIPNQMFEPDQVGQTKAMSLAEAIFAVTSTTEVATYEQRISDGVPLSRVVISALDSMEARDELWRAVKLKPQVDLLLDGRLAGQKVVLYAACPMDMADIAGYEATLYSDDEAEQDSCTARSIIDVGFGIASLMTRAVRKYYAEGLDSLDKITYLNQNTLDILKGGWIE
jgi:molybdopterin/thiamine biosynthesis adenylyltransferase